MDTLDPAAGMEAVPAPGPVLDCRLRDEDHWHHVKVYPRAWTCQVRWQHALPGKTGLRELALLPPALSWAVEDVTYTLHELPERIFGPPWQRRIDGDWFPMGPLAPPVGGP